MLNNMLSAMKASIGEQLREQSYFSTSWRELGLEYDQVLAQEVIAASTEKLQRPPVDQGVVREARAVSDNCKRLAKKMVTPLVEHLFDGDKYAEARNSWFLFGVNYYETGDLFPRHRDLNNPDIMTIAIVSLCGVRSLRVGNNQPIEMVPGSVVLLDGANNPIHLATCVEGPSVSVVADVPELLY